jgi:hypothetical protein
MAPIMARLFYQERLKVFVLLSPGQVADSEFLDGAATAHFPAVDFVHGGAAVRASAWTGFTTQIAHCCDVDIAIFTRLLTEQRGAGLPI